jgi:hypothetical protein
VPLLTSLNLLDVEAPHRAGLSELPRYAFVVTMQTTCSKFDIGPGSSFPAVLLTSRDGTARQPVVEPWIIFGIRDSYQSGTPGPADTDMQQLVGHSP